MDFLRRWDLDFLRRWDLDFLLDPPFCACVGHLLFTSSVILATLLQCGQPILSISSLIFCRLIAFSAIVPAGEAAASAAAFTRTVAAAIGSLTRCVYLGSVAQNSRSLLDICNLCCIWLYIKQIKKPYFTDHLKAAGTCRRRYWRSALGAGRGARTTGTPVGSGFGRRARRCRTHPGRNPRLLRPAALQ